MSEINFDSKEYKRSRSAYMWQCAFEHFVSLLAADAFLAKVLTALGISDSLTGIISSFISLSFVFQLLSVFIMQFKTNVKKFVIVFDTACQLLFMLVYLLPFAPFSAGVKTALVIIAIIGAYACKYIVLSMYFKWANTFVHPKKRAIYSANKEILSLVGGIIFTLIVGYVMGKFEAFGNLAGGFIFISVAIFILTVCNFIALVLIKNGGEEKEETAKSSLRDVINSTLFNKNFLNVIIMTCLWNVAQYFSVGFLGIYKTKDLMLSIFAIQVINMIADGCRILVSRFFGRFSDKHSYAVGMELALCVAAVSFFFNVFATKSCWFFVVVHTILYHVSLAGSEQNAYNISYSYVPAQYVTQAIAIKNSIGGLCGFGAALIAGKLLDFVQNNNNVFLGVHIYGQQMLSLISFVITIVAIVFIHKVIRKQKVTVQ